MHGAELDANDMKNEDGRAVYGSSERIETVPVWVPSVEKLHLVVWENYSSEDMTRRHGAFLDCVVPFCSLDENRFRC